MAEEILKEEIEEARRNLVVLHTAAMAFSKPRAAKAIREAIATLDQAKDEL